MNVVIVNRYYFPDESATSRMVTSLATALAGRGFRIHVLAGRRRHDDASAVLPASESVAGVDVHRIWTSGFGRARLIGRALDYITFHLCAVLFLLRHLRRGDLCIVCTDPPLLSVTALVASTVKRAVLVNWIMDLFPEVAIDLGVLRKGSLAARAALALRNLSLRRAGMNVAPIRKMADLLATYGVDRRTISVVHHWSDGESLRPMDPEDSNLRREWGLSGKFVVGYSGNLGRAHEFATLLDAAESFSGRSDVAFLFVGGGYRLAHVREEVRRRGLSNVIFKPLQPRNRLADCLAAADVHFVSLLPDMEPYIVPSKFYGIAAAGRPVMFVGDPEGEISQVLRRTGCGLAVAIGDARALAEALDAFSRSEPLRRQMGARARAVFEAEFAEERGIADWSRLLETLASPSRVGGKRATQPRPGVVRG